MPAGSTVGLIDAKVAIITGVSRGIGAASARAFAAEGASVVLAARSGEPMAAIAEELVAAVACPTDVTNATAVERLVALAVRHRGASTSHSTTPEPATLHARWRICRIDEFELTVRANLLGVFVAMKHAWLCSDQASYIHGVVASIDGGRLAGAPAAARPPSSS